VCQDLCKITPIVSPVRSLVPAARSVLWCGFSHPASGKLLHVEHDWYDHQSSGYVHCYGTSRGE
jgi:hypothetical protein